MPGYIKLYRDIQHNELWQEKPYSRGQAWVDILLMANHEDKSIIFDGNLIEIKKGSFITSIRKLSDKWGWSRTKVCKYLEVLSVEKMILQNSDTKKTAITIVNWDLYQAAKDTEETQKSHRNDTEKPQKSTNKNIKNDKEVKEDIKDIGGKPLTHKFIPPTIEQVKAYCTERQNKVDPAKWYDFYESKGWMVGKNKMKDWQAAIRTWEHEDKSRSPTRPTKATQTNNFTQRQYDDSFYDGLYKNQ